MKNKIKVSIEGLGIYRDYINEQDQIIFVEKDIKLFDLIKYLNKKLGNKFYNNIIKNKEINPNTIIFLNGINIHHLEGLDTIINENDRIVFGIMVNGG